MKIVAIVVGVILLLVVALLILGALQPAGHVASSWVEYSQSPAALWAVLTDFEHWPQWNSAAQRMVRESDRDGKPVWVMSGQWGEMPSIVEVWEPPSRMVTRIPEDADLGFTGSWTYEIQPVAGGARLQITERGQVDNLLFRAFMTFSSLHATQEQFLRDLGRKFGETVEPQRLPVSN